MNRIVIIVSLLLLLTNRPFVSLAQFDDDDPKPKRPLRERLFTGGGVIFDIGGTTVGNPPIPVSITRIGVSPILGYRITEKLSAGLGVTYIYYREKIKGYPAYNTNIYGGNVFSQYTIWKSLFAYAEYGVTNWEVAEIDQFGHYTGRLKRINTFSLPVGGGFAQPISRNSSFRIMALYDLLYYENAYPLSYSPLSFRAGVNIGF